MDLLAAKDLHEVFVPESSEEGRHTQLKATFYRFTVGIAVCAFACWCITGMSNHYASEGQHVVELAAYPANGTAHNANRPVPTQGWQERVSRFLFDPPTQEAERVARFVMDPQAMYNAYGIVSMPIAYLNLKGFVNFGIQLVLFLGSSLWLGKDAIKTKAISGLRFSKVSIGFQVFGQLGVVFGMKSVMMTTKPWQGTDQLLVCCLLISQHASAITALTGLANNSIIFWSLVPDKSMSHDELGWAKWLMISGMIISIPIWVSMVVSLPVMFIGLWCGYNFMSCNNVVNNPPAMLFWGTFSSLLFLHLVWLIMALTEEHMWLMFAAYLLEFLAPLAAFFYFVVQGFFDARFEQPVGSMFNAFVISMSISYMITTCVPAAVLFYTSDVGYRGAAPSAFWGKKITVYGRDTFMIPAEHTEDMMGLWWSQMIGFFS